MERSQRELEADTLHTANLDVRPVGGPSPRGAEATGPSESVARATGEDAKVVSLDSRRRSAQANDDVEYLVATLAPEDLLTVGSSDRPVDSGGDSHLRSLGSGAATDLSHVAPPGDGIPSIAAMGEVLSNILVQLLGDAQKERDAARAELGRLHARLHELVALTKRWEQHAAATEAWTERSEALHEQVVDALTTRYVDNEARLLQGIRARDEAIDEMSQLVARTECNLIDALVARDAALEVARELLAERWLRRWKRQAYEARIDSIAAG